MRPQTACEFCRSRRRRCQRIPNSAICALCQKHNVPCIASTVTTPTKPSHARGSGIHVGIAARPSQSDAASNARVASPRLDAGSPHAVSLPQYSSQQGGVTSPCNIDHGATEDFVLPPSAVCFHLATLYFDYVHDQLHTLFQKPAFMADMVMNKCPPVIMFAVVALSARSVDQLHSTSICLTVPDSQPTTSLRASLRGPEVCGTRRRAPASSIRATCLCNRSRLLSY